MKSETTVRSFIFVISLLLPVVTAPNAASEENTLPAKGYIGIWADSLHSDCDVSPPLYTPFDVWIYCLPSVNGLQAAEFAVSFPATVFTVSTVQHPDITVSLGSLPAGISVAFGHGDCQMDWVWTHHLTCISLADTPGFISIIPHPAVQPVPAYQFASCLPGYPIEPCAIYSNLFVNQWCGPPPAPVLTGVEVVNPLTIRAMASHDCIRVDWTGHSLADFFKLRNVADPTDSILMTAAEIEGEAETQVLLTLDRQMIDGTTYTLEARFCNCYYRCADSEWEFSYPGGFEPSPNIRFSILNWRVWASECADAPVEFTIANNGSASTDSFDVELACVYESGPLSEEIVASRRYGGLGAGETLSDAFIAPLRYFEAVKYQQFQVRIDAREEVEEWAEIDNTGDILVYNDYPHIYSILDVPDDMGGAVEIAFSQAGYHQRNYSLPNTYLILRRMGHSDVWEQVAEVPGTWAASYSVTAPTCVDSSGAASDYWSTYKVMLRTVLNTAPPDTVYHASCPDSGYSIDNTGPTATLLQSCSASFGAACVEIVWELLEMDAGLEFSVSRSENGAEFVALDMAGLEREGLSFTYKDAAVEPGKRYVYKVEYTLEGRSRLLFISEEIRTPAALLSLEQNRPNPFNPSTTISFSLPAACAVRLEVYDVSGRLVARLVDGARLSAGPHDVEWNGRDASGRAAASGIYVYRLVAGKETLSRKMVLLR